MTIRLANSDTNTGGCALGASVHMLWYVRELEEGEEDSLFIGVYESSHEAKAAIERLKSKPGFVDDLNGFQIHEYVLNKDHWTDGFIVD